MSNVKVGVLAVAMFLLGWRIKGEIDRSFVADSHAVLHRYQAICADIRRKDEIGKMWLPRLPRPAQAEDGRVLTVSFGPLRRICDSP